MLPLILGAAILFTVLRSILPRLALRYAQFTTPTQASEAQRTAAASVRARQLNAQITTVLWIAEAALQYSFTFFKRNTQVLQFQEGTIPGVLGYVLSLNQVYALFYASGITVKQVQALLV
ncbi:hypothetical protein BCR37DRAFT_384269 [Protomyces lactucae-debilis]|uniref:Uncharacterized protein n=1 Tax=Protomyces lactucae-debilis TaxID=2754530 RepID=A0A1Y2ETF4_PROLT|nr:uncharacterized protein BCR37DRAFT_384269 [Protomyces lactucae-debilis]ORY74843.1 hypothetical protein BCR37DRAFT_384269 [Protomyces lactucae-debilis]